MAAPSTVSSSSPPVKGTRIRLGPTRRAPLRLWAANPHHPRQQRAAKDLHAASLVGRSDEDVGGTTLARDSANGLHEIVAFLFEKANAKDAGESMKRGQLRYLLWGRLAAWVSYPERIDLGAEPLC
jgi:hypothetical protein